MVYHFLINKFISHSVRSDLLRLLTFERHLPSLSTFCIISCSSLSVGFCPRALIVAPSSSLDMVPLPSLSNKRNASLYSVKVKKLVRGAIIVKEL